MSSLVINFRYRPEIDGLRAIAVLAGVFYHAGFQVPGGFVGVDVFFVISGYLITSLVIKDIETGKFSMVGFWERRIRRILPALSLVVFVTLVAGAFLLLPDDWAELGKSAVSQAVCLANIFFLRNTGYFDGKAEEMPLLHTWSLAVEEQFYLIAPLLLVTMFRIGWKSRRLALLTGITAGILISLALRGCLKNTRFLNFNLY